MSFPNIIPERISSLNTSESLLYAIACPISSKMSTRGISPDMTNIGKSLRLE